MRMASVICALVLFSFAGASAAEMVDHFSDPELDEQIWNFGQADPALIGYGTEPDSARTYMALRIDAEREATDKCTLANEQKFVEEWNVLGPTFFVEPPAANAGSPERACVRAELRSGRPVAQRNEIRFANRDLHPSLDEDIWYFLTFRLKGYDGDRLPLCGSARWIIGQWKYNNMKPGTGGSPFLAQRFDNGVLHLTIEDNGCRCMIAKAGGDPDLMRLRQTLTPPDPSQLNEALPLECRFTEGDTPNGRCTPQHLVLKARDLEDLSTLPDPKQDWIDMAYHIRAGDPEGARIDVYANGHFIVRAEGDIDPHLPGNRVKFKIGHYRDMIPVKAELLLDELCVSPSLATCASARKP